MIELVYSPRWFYGKDIAIDIISMIVLFLIAAASFKYYRINRHNGKLRKLALSFILLAWAFIFKVLMNFTVYYTTIETKRIAWFTFTYEAMRSTDTLFFWGYLLYRLLTLVGLFLLLTLYEKNTKRSMALLILYLLVILTYFSQSAYYIFHMTSLILLLMIASSMRANAQKKKTKESRMLALSFMIIASSQVLFIFIRIHDITYALAELVQLIGYVVLLISFISVIKHGKKKKQDRHHP